VLAEFAPLHLFQMRARTETAPAVRFGAAILGHLQLDPKLRELEVLQVAVVPGAIRVDGARADRAHRRGQRRSRRSSVSCSSSPPAAGPTVNGATFAMIHNAPPPRQIVELLLTIGNYLMLARVMTTLEIEVDAAVGNAFVDAGVRRPLRRRASTPIGRRRHRHRPTDSTRPASALPEPAVSRSSSP
jgi:4-carboxymuconolactone decarboxylase